MTLEELVDPRQAALLVVDMQNDFCHENGALPMHGGDPSMIQEMAPRLRHLIGVARKIRLPIVHVRTHHSQWTDSASWVGRFQAPYRLCYPGTWGADFYEGFEPEVSDEWEPGRHEYVVTKHRYSGFIGTDLDQVLRSRGIETVIMTGEATNVCVETTARDAYMRDYFVVFLGDCTASTAKAAHDATLFTMGKHFGKVVDSTDVIAAWEKIGALTPAPAGTT